MRISAKTDYAVRAAAELAARSEEGWIKTESVATAQQIPLAFLLNILAELRTAGLVQSRRGVDGGYRLARPATEITVADVIRAVDGPLANIAGARPEDMEYGGAATSLRDTWVALRATMRSVLEAVSLADLAQQKLPEHVTGHLNDDDVWRARV
ncbi:MAG: Rrf2 family transcriptional regulator [Kineosporiaceae bacterium]